MPPVKAYHDHRGADAVLTNARQRLPAVPSSALPALADAVTAEVPPDVLREPIHLADDQVQLSMSVGLATPQSRDESLDSHLRRADRAMYEAMRKRIPRAPIATAKS